MSLSKLTAIAAMTVLTVGCTDRYLRQTPMSMQEPLVEKQDYTVKYGEDRIALRFKPRTTGLSYEQKDYIARFLNHYKNAGNTKTLVSLLKPIDQEDLGKLPTHSPYTHGALSSVIKEVMTHDITPKVISEIDTHEDQVHLESRALKAIMDTADVEDTGLETLAPDLNHYENDIKIAVIVREYHVTPNGCANTTAQKWNNVRLDSHRINTGCATRTNILAQIKDKSVLAGGEAMTPGHDPALEVLRIREIKTGTFEPDFDTALERDISVGED